MCPVISSSSRKIGENFILVVSCYLKCILTAFQSHLVHRYVRGCAGTQSLAMFLEINGCFRSFNIRQTPLGDPAGIDQFHSPKLSTQRPSSSNLLFGPFNLNTPRGSLCSFCGGLEGSPLFRSCDAEQCEALTQRKGG